MSKYDIDKIQKKLKKRLDGERYHHTLGVMYTASCLAMVHGVNMEEAQVAGLLHDCAKCIPNNKKLKLCKKYHVSITSFERNHPFLIHAKLGANIAKYKYEVEDRNILDAITWHTTGKPNMADLEKIIYIADYIEPARDRAPRLPYLRKIAFRDLDLCMYEILQDSLAYLSANPEDIDEMTMKAYNYYEKLMECKKESSDE